MKSKGVNLTHSAEITKYTLANKIAKKITSLVSKTYTPE